MQVFYEVEPGSEAHRLILEYRDKCREHRGKLKAEAERLGSSEPDRWLKSDGVPCGIRFDRKPSDDWKEDRQHRGFYWPKRRKVNKEIIELLESLTLDDVVTLSKHVFGCCPLHFRGLRVAHGCSCEEISVEHMVVGFVDADHARLYREAAEQGTGRWPEGITNVRASDVMRWREDASEE